MTWWGWMILGAILLGAELFAVDAQFYLVFLGLSAVLVGLAEVFGVAMPVWGQWLAFSVLSLISFFVFRRSLYEKIRGGAVGFNETLSGKYVEVPAELAPGTEARLDYRGTKWTVRNTGESPIAAGTRAMIEKVDGLTLHLKADNE